MGLSLTYSTYSCVLPSPELGDILRFSSGAINRKLKGGLPKIFKDPLWPVIEIRQYSIRNCTLVQKTDFENLYRAAVGLSVTLQDSYGVLINGLIMNPTVEVLSLDDRNCGSYDIEFEFLCTVIKYPLEDCLTQTFTIVEDTLNRTLENDAYYTITTEAGSPLTNEAGSPLFIESY